MEIGHFRRVRLRIVTTTVFAMLAACDSHVGVGMDMSVPDGVDTDIVDADMSVPDGVDADIVDLSADLATSPDVAPPLDLAMPPDLAPVRFPHCIGLTTTCGSSG